jgi:hypothetical protein
VRSTTWTLAAFAVLGCGFATAATAPEGNTTGRIARMSHYHPPGASYSFVCARVKGTRGKRAVAKVTGPAVASDPRHRFRFPRDKEGKYTLSWTIRSPGVYYLKLTNPTTGERLDRAQWRVPSPPPAGSRRGPFVCPSSHRAGWPDVGGVD